MEIPAELSLTLIFTAPAAGTVTRPVATTTGLGAVFLAASLAPAGSSYHVICNVPGSRPLACRTTPELFSSVAIALAFAAGVSSRASAASICAWLRVVICVPSTLPPLEGGPLWGVPARRGRALRFWFGSGRGFGGGFRRGLDLTRRGFLAAAFTTAAFLNVSPSKVMVCEHTTSTTVSPTSTSGCSASWSDISVLPRRGCFRPSPAPIRCWSRGSRIPPPAAPARAAAPWCTALRPGHPLAQFGFEVRFAFHQGFDFAGRLFSLPPAFTVAAFLTFAFLAD